MQTDSFTDINILIHKILEEHIPTDEVEEEISQLITRYGDNVFPDIIFSPRDKPWDADYLEELKLMNITGACSKEFLLHMTEVSNYIASQKSRKVMFAIISAMILLIVIAGIIVLL